MSTIIFLLSTSIDGYVEGPDGKFDFTFPDEEVHRFHGDVLRSADALLYGRRIYETMAVWETLDANPSTPEYVREFARTWRSKPKIVFSRTLKEVGPNCRLVRSVDPASIDELRAAHPGILAVAGPGLAASFAALDLIDEYHMVLFPTAVGGGKPYFPARSLPAVMKLLETRTFTCGAVLLRYAVRR